MSDVSYQFSVADAQKLGSADLAAIVHNLRFWLRKNLANHKNIHDGRVWTYNTLEAWGKLFPWLSIPQMKRMLKKLEDNGFLVKGNYNKNKFNKTVWYSLEESEFILNQPETPETTEETKSYYRDSESVPGRDDIVPSLTDSKQQISKSVNNSQLDQNFSDKVMTELFIANMPAKEKHYAGLKIREYQERFPDSESVADCWSYVAQAVNHKMNISTS